MFHLQYLTITTSGDAPAEAIEKSHPAEPCLDSRVIELWANIGCGLKPLSFGVGFVT